MSVLQTVTGKRPKLIGTDLDGTIVAHYGFISERTKIAFAAAHAAGIHIYFVTGRPIRWMVEIKDKVYAEYTSQYKFILDGVDKQTTRSLVEDIMKCNSYGSLKIIKIRIKRGIYAQKAVTQ